MGKHIEIKWFGRAGQGVVTAAALLAEVLALDGKYVQAFPQYLARKLRPTVKAFNRVSTTPIKINSQVERAEIVVVMSPRLLLTGDVKTNARDNADYIVNLPPPYTPEFVKQKLQLESNRIYTLDADAVTVAELGKPFPNVPLLSVLLSRYSLIDMERYPALLKECLLSRFEAAVVNANLAAIARALKAVRELEE